MANHHPVDRCPHWIDVRVYFDQKTRSTVHSIENVDFQLPLVAAFTGAFPNHLKVALVERVFVRARLDQPIRSRFEHRARGQPQIAHAGVLRARPEVLDLLATFVPVLIRRTEQSVGGVERDELVELATVEQLLETAVRGVDRLERRGHDSCATSCSETVTRTFISAADNERDLCSTDKRRFLP